MSLLRRYKLNGNTLDSSFNGNHAWECSQSITDNWNINTKNSTIFNLTDYNYTIYNNVNFLEAINSSGKLLWSSKKENFINNNCKISEDYICTGGENKSIELNETINLNNYNTWEWNIKYTHKGNNIKPAILGNGGNITGELGNYKCPLIIINSTNFNIFISSTGNSWDIANNADTGLTPIVNTTYYIKFGFNGIIYYFSYKLSDSNNYNTIWSISNNNKCYCSVPFKLLNHDYNTTDYYNNSEIDLKETYLIMDTDNEYYYWYPYSGKYYDISKISNDFDKNIYIKHNNELTKLSISGEILWNLSNNKFGDIFTFDSKNNVYINSTTNNNEIYVFSTYDINDKDFILTNNYYYKLTINLNNDDDYIKDLKYYDNFIYCLISNKNNTKNYIQKLEILNKVYEQKIITDKKNNISFKDNCCYSSGSNGLNHSVCAFDGDSETYWESNSNTSGSFIVYYTTKKCKIVQIISNSVEKNSNFGNCSIYGSNDNSVWDLIKTVSNESNFVIIINIDTYNLDKNYNYFKIVNNDNRTMKIANINLNVIENNTWSQVYLESDGILNSNNYASRASSVYSPDNLSYKAFDDSESTYWMSANTDKNNFIIYYSPIALKFERVITISQINLTTRNFNKGKIYGGNLKPELKYDVIDGNIDDIENLDIANGKNIEDIISRYINEDNDNITAENGSIYVYENTIIDGGNIGNPEYIEDIMTDIVWYTLKEFNESYNYRHIYEINNTTSEYYNDYYNFIRIESEDEKYLSIVAIELYASSSISSTLPILTNNNLIKNEIGILSSGSIGDTMTEEARNFIDNAEPGVIVLKGTIGTGGTITELPLDNYIAGWCYKVITNGTYAGKTAEIGDTIYCIKSYNSIFSNNDWAVDNSHVEFKAFDNDLNSYWKPDSYNSFMVYYLDKPITLNSITIISADIDSNFGNCIIYGSNNFENLDIISKFSGQSDINKNFNIINLKNRYYNFIIIKNLDDRILKIKEIYLNAKKIDLINKWTYNHNNSNIITTELALSDNYLYFGDNKGYIYKIHNRKKDTNYELAYYEKIFKFGNSVNKLKVKDDANVYALSDNKEIIGINNYNYQYFTYTDFEDIIDINVDKFKDNSIFILYNNKIRNIHLNLLKTPNGIIGDYCYKFNGGNSYIEFTNPYNKNEQINNLSVSLWFNPINLPNQNKNIIISGEDNYNWTSICWVSNLNIYFAIAKNSDVCAISSDGINFVKYKLPKVDEWISCVNIINKSLICIIAKNSDVCYTTEGIDSNNELIWQSKNLPKKSTWSNIYWDDYHGLLILLEKNSNNLYITDTIHKNYPNWGDLENPIDIGDTKDWNDICYSNILDMYVLVCNDSQYLYYSKDLENWFKIQISNTNINIKSITWSPKLNIFMVIIPNSNTYYISLDGMNWTSKTLPFTENWSKVYWANNNINKFYIIGKYCNKVIESYDGNNWDYKELITYHNCSDICYSNVLNNVITIVEDLDNSYVSYGDNWTQNNLPTNVSLQMYFSNIDNSLYILLGNEKIETNFTLDSDSINKWYNIIMTSNKQLISIFINGELYKDYPREQNTPLYFNNNYIRIGDIVHNYETNKYNLYANINEVRLYDHDLNLKEINEISKLKILHYKFNEKTANNNYIYDNSSYLHNLTVGNISPIYDNESKSYKFVNKSEVILSESTYFDNNKQFTLSFWYKNTTNKNKIILGKYDNNLSNGWYVYFDSYENKLKFIVVNNNIVNKINYKKDNNLPYNINNWNNYILTFNNNTLNSYVNSIHNCTEIGCVLKLSTNYFKIGNSNSIYTMDDDYIKDIRIYNTILNNNDILEINNKSNILDSDGNLYTYNFIETNNTNKVNINKEYISVNTIEEYYNITNLLDINNNNNMFIKGDIKDNY